MSVTSTGRPTAVASIAEDDIAWGPVTIKVINIERSIQFWSQVTGLRRIDDSGDGVVLGADEEPLLVLNAGAERVAQRGHSGLYHLALHVPDESAFAATLARIARARVPQAPTDHVMHWATYVTDPDGLGLEISFETLDRFDRYAPDGHGPAVIATDGRSLPAVGPLDLDHVMSYLPSGSIDEIAPGTRVGHMHFHVGDIEGAIDHYRDLLGFTVANRMANFAMTDFSAGGSFPHRLAINEWQGHGAPPQPDSAAQVLSAALKIGDAKRRAQLLASYPDGRIVDPAGNVTLIQR